MEVSQEVVVVVTKKLLTLLILSLTVVGFCMESVAAPGYKKRVLDKSELSILTSYYSQDGDNASVTGGVGTEELTNSATNINVSIPVKEDGVLKIDATVSAYTSASSSNLNPFSSASTGEVPNAVSSVKGSPWVESSGASQSDVWINGKVNYSHYNDKRTGIYSVDVSASNEFDYSSFGFGGGVTRYYNEKNTEFDIKLNVFLDKWRPKQPKEISRYFEYNGNLNIGHFENVLIYDSNGNATDKNSSNTWKPKTDELLDKEDRNSFSMSLRLSQMLNTDSQISFFSDFVWQNGWLANPMQRVYFSDYDNYYIGVPEYISEYESESNTGVFHLADDYERLPDNRYKYPVGVRYSHYLNDYFIMRLYYRLYNDSWDLSSSTASIELPVRISESITFYPGFRYYTQGAAKYFAPYNQHLSTDEYYTSDNDLSEFSSYQLSFGVKFYQIVTTKHIWIFGFKNLQLNYSYYEKDNGFYAHAVSIGTNLQIKK